MQNEQICKVFLAKFTTFQKGWFQCYMPNKVLVKCAQGVKRASCIVSHKPIEPKLFIQWYWYMQNITKILSKPLNLPKWFAHIYYHWTNSSGLIHLCETMQLLAWILVQRRGSAEEYDSKASYPINKIESSASKLSMHTNTYIWTEDSILPRLYYVPKPLRIA